MKINCQGLLPVQGEIVVIEDDPILCELMVDIVEEVGAKALAFETADDALTYLLQAQGECRLVIVDQVLPGQIQGKELIEIVTRKWPAIATILTSGYLINPESVPPSSIYLPKPWSLDDLIVAMASLLQPGYPIHKS